MNLTPGKMINPKNIETDSARSLAQCARVMKIHNMMEVNNSIKYDVTKLGAGKNMRGRERKLDS